MKHLAYLLLFLLLPAASFAQPYIEARNLRLIDFYLVYPIVQLKPEFERRQVGTAGVGLNYHTYFNDHLGVSFNPNAWFVPIRYEGAKAMIAAVGAEAGPSFRMLPMTYLDPTLTAFGGATLIDAGSRVNAKFIYPVGGRVGLNLYRNQQRFSDPSLALHAFGDAKYYFGSAEMIKPLYFDFGLAFRGSF